MFIGIDLVLDVFDAPNIVAFDRIDSAIVATVDEVLRNSILLDRRKVNSRRAHDADDDDEGGKVKSNMYSFNTALIRYLQAVVGVVDAERSICRLHG